MTRRRRSHPASDLEAQARSVLEHAVDAQRKGLKVYESLRSLSEIIGTEYGDRVMHLYFDYTPMSAEASGRA